MFASGFRSKCRHGLALTSIAGGSRPRFQAPDVQRPRHRCRCSIDQRGLWVGYCLYATGSNRPIVLKKWASNSTAEKYAPEIEI